MKASRKLAVCGMIITLTVAACSGDEITSVPAQMLDRETVAMSQIVARPWKGECDVDAVFTSEVTLLITGTCQLAHLGKTTLVAYQTITPGSNGIAYTNDATYTSANGDELRTTNIGVAIPNAAGLSLTGTETAVGGTGRFANATGIAALNGSVRFTGPASTTGSYSLSGTLSY